MIFGTDVITAELLQYAIKLAIDVGHNYPNESGITALERFFLTKGHARVKQFLTFGYPFFILDPKLCQKTKKIDTSIKKSHLSWYIAASCRKCYSGYKYQNWIYLSEISHRL